MISRLLAATKKNLLRLLRRRVSAAAILLGPLLLIIVIGLAFANTELHDIEVATYVPQQNEYVSNILGNLEENENTFRVSYYETKDSCVQSVEDGASHICVTFVQPPGSSKIDAAFYVDYSRLSLVLLLINAMNSRVSAEASQIGADISQSLLERVTLMNRYVETNGRTLANISNNSAQMLSSMQQVRSQIGALDLSNPVDASSLGDVSVQAQRQREQIRAQQKTVKEEIAYAKQEVGRTRSELGQSREELDASQERLARTIRQLDESMEVLQCTGTYSDITPLLEDEEAMREALAAPDAHCKVMYSARLNMLAMQAESERIEAQLNAGHDQLVGAEEQLEEFDAEYTDASNDALEQLGAAEEQLAAMAEQVKEGDARITEMKQTQQSLLAQLDSAQRSMEASTQLLGNVQTGISDVRASLDEVETVTPEAIVRPFSTSIHSVTGSTRQFDFLFPSLLALVIMFVSVLAASTIVMKEKGSRAYFRNLIMPSPTFIFFTGIILTSTLLAGLQVAIILAMGYVFFDTNLLASPLLLIIVLLLGIWLFSLLGIIFGFLFNSEETTTLVSIMTGVILFFFSSMIIPMESMDPTLAAIARFNPFVLLELLLRQALIFEDAALGMPFVLLVIEVLLLFGAAVAAISWARKQT